MADFLCATCGTQFPPGDEPPDSCPVCEDERQYVGFDGQEWTSLAELRPTHANQIRSEEAGLSSIATEPKFAIGERALLVESPGGNLLWDCVALLDDHTAGYIRDRGGLQAIAISHPHYYTTMVEWSRAFGDVPVYLHRDDQQWVMRPDPCQFFWQGEQLRLHDGLTLIRAGGHFAGGTVLHWPAGAEGRGALLTGDIIQVVPDRRWVSFMYSYPNFIPLGAAAVEQVTAAVEPFPFERIYGAFDRLTVARDGKGALRRSKERYLGALQGG